MYVFVCLFVLTEPSSPHEVNESSVCLVCTEPLVTVIMSVGGLTELGQLRGDAAVDEAKMRRFPHLKSGGGGLRGAATGASHAELTLPPLLHLCSAR